MFLEIINKQNAGGEISREIFKASYVKNCTLFARHKEAFEMRMTLKAVYDQVELLEELFRDTKRLD